MECRNHPGPSIIVPHRPFRGHLGTTEYLWNQGWAITQQRLALRVLRLAAIERHHIHGRREAFTCPAPNCDVIFERPEEFTTHVVNPPQYTPDKHDNSYVLPEPYQSLFAVDEMRLDQLKLRYREVKENFVKWWGRHGSEERGIAENEFSREDPSHMHETLLDSLGIWNHEDMV
jgi:hypothetical protein